MIFGAVAGRLLASGRARAEIRTRLVIGGAAAVALGLLASVVCPIIKSLWTPSWTLVSTGLTLWCLAASYELREVRGYRRGAGFLIGLGSNPILLYVLAMNYRAWVLEYWRRIAPILSAVSWAPVVESLVFAGTLWVVAWVLHRGRIYVRI
jgi:predicted acyltransferase